MLNFSCTLFISNVSCLVQLCGSKGLKTSKEGLLPVMQTRILWYNVKMRIILCLTCSTESVCNIITQEGGGGDVTNINMMNG